MKSKNVKVVDQNNIDRDANVIFALDLEGSEYVVYWIERDDDENNIFVSKVIKDTDGTSSLLDIEDADEKKNVSEVVKKLIAQSVKDENDALTSESIVLEDGKIIRFVNVSFNKEQKMNIQKTYITTVQKEVTRVSEKYYGSVVVDTPKVVEDVFPTVAPVVSEVKEEVLPEQSVLSVESPVEVPTPVLSTPVVDVANVAPVEVSASQPVIPTVEETPVEQVQIVEPITVAAPVNVEIPQPEPVAIEPVIPAVPEVTPVVPPVVSSLTEVAKPEVVVPTEVVPTPVNPTPSSVVAPEPVVAASQPLVFNASKETNLNAALGEAAKDTTIPVENIEPVREFGVDEPVKTEVSPQPVVTPTPVAASADASTAIPVSPKSGFANSKFFMVVAIAFFLASCVFLGYEVFNYFQLTK